MKFTKMDESIALVYDGIGMMKLIYGKQAVIDDVDIHATPYNILHKYESKAVILCECDQIFREFDQ